MIAHESGTGRPLILIHGFGVDHRILLPLDPIVAASGWRRIYVDLPWVTPVANHPPSSTQEVADALLAELQGHLGDEPFAILGNSFGGMLARYIAHEGGSQVLGLATVAGAFVADAAERTLPDHRVIVADADIVHRAESSAPDYLEIAVTQTDETLRAFEELILPGVQRADLRVMAKIAASYALDHEPEEAHPEPFDRPSLHIFGRQDQVTGYEDGLALRDHYSRGTFVVVDAAGHNVHLERPDLVGPLITDWLGRIDVECGGVPTPPSAHPQLTAPTTPR